MQNLFFQVLYNIIHGIWKCFKDSKKVKKLFINIFHHVCPNATSICDPLKISKIMIFHQNSIFPMCGPNDIYVYIWPKLAPWGSKNMFKSPYTCLGSIWGHLRKIDFFDFLDYEKNFFDIYIYTKSAQYGFFTGFLVFFGV